MVNDFNNIIYSDILLSTVLRGLSCFFSGVVDYIVYKKISHFRPTYFLGSLVETILIFSVICAAQSDMQNKGDLCSILFIFTVLLLAFESG